ncbi:MAG: TraX family protein [Tissierellia bacterium]|nr:TraX family protein [Tissierellia bacterium]
MNYTILKLIASITMLIDHIGAVFGAGHLGYLPYDQTFVLRAIGRTAFPIYAFTISNGWQHTRDKEKYLERLLLFMVLSQVPFTLSFFSLQSLHAPQPMPMIQVSELAIRALLILALLAISWFSELLMRPTQLIALGFALFLSQQEIFLGGVLLNSPNHLNVFYTLGSGAIAFAAIDRIVDNGSLRITPKGILAVLTAAGICYFLCAHSDYGYSGLAIVCAFYLLRNNRHLQAIAGAIWVLYTYPFAPNLISFSTFGLLAILLLLLYNGKKGSMPSWAQRAFYWFYPVHLFLFGIIQILLIQ